MVNYCSRLPNPDRLFYTYPKFFGSKDIATAVRNRKGEMSLALVDAVDGSTRYLVPFSFQTIGFPSVSGDTIWFTASRGREDRVYAWTKDRIFRVILPHGEPVTGQYELQTDGRGRYVWNSFTAVGFWIDTTRMPRLEPIGGGEWAEGLSVQGIDSLDHGPSRLLDRIEPGHYPETNYPHHLSSHQFPQLAALYQRSRLSAVACQRQYPEHLRDGYLWRL